MPTDPPELPPDHGELWKALRTAWLEDPHVSQLLSQSNDGGSIYMSYPHQKIEYPAMVITPLEPKIDRDASYLGLSWETLQVNSYALDRHHGRKAFAVFQSQWSIPWTRGEFISENWRISSMIWSTPIDIGKLRTTNDDRDIWEFACECKCRVNRITPENP